MKRRTAPRILLTVAIATMVLSLIGFIATMALNAFVLDKYNAYGEVPIPGTASLHLPAGEATISFHTQVIGTTSGGGLPVPNLRMNIEPPAGVAEPVVVENWGTTTTVNSDARVRVWTAQIPQEGDYTIRTAGDVGGYISPRLAFGHSSSQGTLPWIFAGIFAAAMLGLFVALIWLSRVKRRPVPDTVSFDTSNVSRVFVNPSPPTHSPGSAAPYSPTDDGVRIEQLKTLAALRESGALTDDEFQKEKRRLLDGR
ncbi:SHOCT domain-containing protein [Mycolicibacterium komossense]|uniref:SHOCT domain-containing protein n=1 Tax=Mycolicibacterium komossense TaxID=1779 RepID=A0ABT3C667_9MYCO|nr:SHOCT domain-containing protein [Mycolicibacterium komossense]MCV7224945.1 SHOCT domain-containing protein [Mycolicibacterium komossense]